MDPLSDVLSLLKPRSYVSAGFDAGGDWSIQFSDQHGRIKCYAVISGACWLGVDGVADAVRLQAGDCFVLPSGRPFRLASDMTLPSVDAGTIFPPARDGGVVTYNGGGDFFLVGSRFAVSGNHGDVLLRMLPPIVHIRKETEQAALRWSVERMMQELHARQPGSFLVAQHLAHMMLVQALRLHLTDSIEGGTGWFYALADKQLCAAISAIHSDPARRWTLDALAECAGMSRSTFAQKFKDKVGETPIEYLTRWRMLLAGEKLSKSNDSISVIALSLGYESESAFSTAFKRIMACTPRQYSRVRHIGISANREDKRGSSSRFGLGVA
ncbi:AraC family transcriptional regulator [Pseudorhodoplanes sinuspersici]|uniref:AraC family transcriptional regulator n=1 Tax=Pseudorhodoplanes sinuspersici TaxID=1235591 RepID=A0A1W6ZQT9_9HYPH|nr:AraC family transcriptional regulator [Pseudorhodoplanes sinuspersici]ARP99645.1 AraC family transcriptional regulator [Pseudorhodoplanes sinuspersici]RKE70621.1 AraC-like DNA-binding protein [Pseudorhodoplanes sinuspersici]